MEEKIIDLLKRAKRPLSLDKIMEKIGIESLEEKEEILMILDKKLEEYSIIKTAKDNYVLLEKTSFRKGRFYGDRNGEGKVVVNYPCVLEDGRKSIKEISYDILASQTNGAIDGDYVLVNLYSSKKNGPLLGSVKSIIERNLNNITGIVYSIGNKTFVNPIDKKKRNLKIMLDDKEFDGLRVAVSLNEKIDDNTYRGTVKRRFNHIFDPTEDILWEAFKCGLEYEFSNETLEEVKNIPDVVRDIDKVGRSDFTDWEIFTIDGADTKDIDDALSLKKLDNGNFLVGVHIADVSNYVKIDSALEKDALKRGTSAYLAGKVIPMLPKELSNGICSLNPDVERLAISCLMEVDTNGLVVNRNICKSVIKSKKKMTYKEVNNILHDREYDVSYQKHIKTLKELNELALILKNNRIKDGALQFSRPELKISYDEYDKVSSIDVDNNDLGENLIEEFMLLANETVDKYLSSRNLPCIHRIHDIPDFERMENFFRLLSAIGHEYLEHDYYDCCLSLYDLQDLEKFIRKQGRISDVLSSNLIRCMSRAKYSTDSIGHFGLAKEHYCHFTSPIRRYPDLAVHRILKADLDDIDIHNYCSKLPEIALHSSKTERMAFDAEMQTLKMRCCEYMEKFVGEEFNGVVTDTSQKGLFVQLDNFIEGRVSIKNLPGHYIYSESDYSLISLDEKDDYTVGDYLKLKLLSTNKEKKDIDFEVVRKLENVRADIPKVKKKVK